MKGDVRASALSAGLLVFLCATIGMWVGMHYYTYRNLAAAGADPRILIPVLWFLALSFPSARLMTLRWHNPALDFFYRLGAIWMGMAFLLSFWLLVASLARRVLDALGWPPAADPRPWILGTCAAVTAMGLWGLINASRGPRQVRYTVDRSYRYGKGKKLKIVQISDVHLGLTLGLEYLGKLVAAINRLGADLVFITGDLFDPEFSGDERAGDLLRQVRAREGVFAVSGNHEFYAGLHRFLEMMERAGIPVLDNTFRVTASGLQVAGIHDQTANRFDAAGATCDLAKALEGLDASQPSVLLAHQPKELEPAVAKGVDVIFSGHTHNGQIFPFRFMVRLAYKYLAGLHRLGPETVLIVCTGTGFWGPPLRVGSDSQIVIVDLLI